MEGQNYKSLKEAYRSMFTEAEKPTGAYPVPVPFRSMRPVQVHKTNVEIDVTQPYVGPGEVEKAYYSYPASFDPTNREDVVKDQKYNGSEARPAVGMNAESKEEIEIIGDYLLESGLVSNADDVDSFFNHMSDSWKSHIIEVACWDTHKKVGMKKKGGKMVNDCVPK